MKKDIKIMHYFGHAMVALSLLSLTYVAVMAWISPYHVMLLVNQKLSNTDAMSSIRGVYGGGGFFIVILLVWFWRKNLKLTLLFLSLFWFLYASCRLVTWTVDGPLGDFGNQWLIMETLFGSVTLLIALTLLKKNANKTSF